MESLILIPLADCHPTRRKPLVNWLLIALNLGVFLYETTLPASQLNRLIATFGMVPADFFAAVAHPAQTPFEFWETLITSQFLHAGWAHILGNLVFLWVFGDNIEDALGHIAYLIFYLASGVLAGIAQSLAVGASPVPAIGASGAIAGVLGAYILLYPWVRIKMFFPLLILIWTLEIPAVIVIGWWFIVQFASGIHTLSGAVLSGIAVWAHIGGFFAGFFLILPLWVRVSRASVPQWQPSPSQIYVETERGNSPV